MRRRSCALSGSERRALGLMVLRRLAEPFSDGCPFQKTEATLGADGSDGQQASPLSRPKRSDGKQATAPSRTHGQQDGELGTLPSLERSNREQPCPSPGAKRCDDRHTRSAFGLGACQHTQAWCTLTTGSGRLLLVVVVAEHLDRILFLRVSELERVVLFSFAFPEAHHLSGIILLFLVLESDRL